MGYTDVPTPYSGLVFRSRHEATWAAFFDACGWRWEYQRWEYQPWDSREIPPTFLLWFEEPVYVLVRPAASEEALIHLAEIVSRYGRESSHGILYPNVLLLDLAPPLNNGRLGGAKIGLIGSRDTGWPRFDRGPVECLEDAHLARCRSCHALTIVSEKASDDLLHGLRWDDTFSPVAWIKGRALWHRAKRLITEVNLGV